MTGIKQDLVGGGVIVYYRDDELFDPQEKPKKKLICVTSLTTSSCRYATDVNNKVLKNSSFEFRIKGELVRSRIFGQPALIRRNDGDSQSGAAKAIAKKKCESH